MWNLIKKLFQSESEYKGPFRVPLPIVYVTKEEYNTLSESAKMVLGMYRVADGEGIDISSAFGYLSGSAFHPNKRDNPGKFYDAQDGLMELEQKGWVEQTNIDEWEIRKDFIPLTDS